MKRAHGQASRGLTLVELITGLAVALAVLTAALGLLHQMGQVRRRQEVQEQLGSNAGWLLGTMGRELRQAGLGRPRSSRAEGTRELFPATFLIAEDTQVAFVADLPRPDSAFNGFSAFASAPFPTSTSLALMNELNGGCNVGSPLLACNSNDDSLLFSDPGVGCSIGVPGARTCPWALGRYRDNEHLLVVGGSGRWVERQLGAPMQGGVGLGRALRITTSLPTGLMEGGPSRAWVSTPDRVFYRLTPTGATRELQRMQCWGSVGSPATLADFRTGCDPGSAATGTGWETLATGLTPGALDFTYLDASGAALARPVPDEALPRVRRVVVRLTLEQSIAGTPQTHTDIITVLPRP
jgi:hypothetical protein